MKKVLALFLCLALCLAMLPVFARAEGGEDASLSQHTIDRIDAYVQREMARGKIPGLSIAIVRGDQLVYSAGYGLARDGGEAVTADTPSSSVPSPRRSPRLPCASWSIWESFNTTRR